MDMFVSFLMVPNSHHLKVSSILIASPILVKCNVSSHYSSRKRGRGINNEKIPMEVINAQLPEQMTPQLSSCWFLHTHTAASRDTYVENKTHELSTTSFLPPPWSPPPPAQMLFISMCCDIRLTNYGYKGKDEPNIYNLCTEQCRSSSESWTKAWL